MGCEIFLGGYIWGGVHVYLLSLGRVWSVPVPGVCLVEAPSGFRVQGLGFRVEG